MLEVAILYAFYCMKLNHDADYMQMNIRIEKFQIRNSNELRFIQLDSIKMKRLENCIS